MFSWRILIGYHSPPMVVFFGPSVFYSKTLLMELFVNYSESNDRGVVGNTSNGSMNVT
jgi:hypothetical protein